jgi:hypothetical protein
MSDTVSRAAGAGNALARPATSPASTGECFFDLMCVQSL